MKQLLFAILMLAAANVNAADDALYAELGGQPGVERAVDAIMAEVRGDKRIKDLFTEENLPYLRERLIEQICNISGGPCEYTGLSMEDAHSGMAITGREFNWFVEDVEIGLEKAGIKLSAQNDLLARFAKMRGDIVGK